MVLHERTAEEHEHVHEDVEVHEVERGLPELELLPCGVQSAGTHEDAERPVAGLDEGDELVPQCEELVGGRDEDSYPEIGSW